MVKPLLNTANKAKNSVFGKKKIQALSSIHYHVPRKYLEEDTKEVPPGFSGIKGAWP